MPRGFPIIKPNDIPRNTGFVIRSMKFPSIGILALARAKTGIIK